MKQFIINDPGGYIGMHIMQGKIYAAMKANLIIVYCASACLNMLAQVPVDNVCFEPSAWIGYHSAKFDGVHPESPATMRWERGSDWIAKGWRKC